MMILPTHIPIPQACDMIQLLSRTEVLEGVLAAFHSHRRFDWVVDVLVLASCYWTVLFRWMVVPVARVRVVHHAVVSPFWVSANCR